MIKNKNFNSKAVTLGALMVIMIVSIWETEIQDSFALSDAGQNYWMLIGWDTGHFFFLIKKTLGNQEGMITLCWLAEHACIKLVSRFKRILKRNFRNASQQGSVFWWKSKSVLIRSLKNVWVGTSGVARSIELQNFMAAKLKVNFFVLLRVSSLVLQVTLSAQKAA